MASMPLCTDWRLLLSLICTAALCCARPSGDFLLRLFVYKSLYFVTTLFLVLGLLGRAGRSDPALRRSPTPPQQPLFFGASNLEIQNKKKTSSHYTLRHHLFTVWLGFSVRDPRKSR